MAKERSRKQTNELRKRAEIILAQDPQAIRNMATTDIQKLIHELNVHQIELEMQNAELRRTQLELEEARDIYLNLYDFAPTGYFTLDRNSLIVDVNLVGTELLGNEKHRLIGTPFTSSVSPDSQDAFYFFLREVFKIGIKGNCELNMLRSDGTLFPAQLISRVVLENDGKINLCRIAVIDITERKRSEEKLYNEATRRHILIDQSRDGIVVLDQNGKVYEANQRFAEMLGYSPEEILNLSVWDWEYRYPSEQVEEMIRSVDEKGSHLETLHRRKDGTTFNVEISTNGALFGKQKLIFCVCRDVTERKQAEEELNAREIRFRGLFQNMSSGVVVYEAIANGDDFIIKDLNSSAENIEKVRKEDAVGKSVQKVFPGVKEFGIFDVFQRVWCSGKAEHFPAGFYHDARISGWRENYVYKLPSGEVVAVYDDVTERKKYELEKEQNSKFLQTLIDSIPLPVFYKDANGKYLGCNSSYCQLLGIEKEELIGKDVYEISPKSLADIYNNKDRELMDNPGTQVYESQVKDKMGEMHNVIFHKATIPALDGGIGGLVGAILDITDRKKAEEQIARSKSLLQIVIDSAPDRIAVKDSKHRYLLVNKNLADALNCQPQDMIGKLDSEFFNQEHLNGNPEKGIRSIREDDATAFSGDVVRGVSRTGDEPRGSFIFDSYRIPLKDPSGTIYGVLVNHRDITELYTATENLKKSYEKVQTVLDETVEAIATICETRDPYTAGHQNRVSQLACAIALEMGMNEEVISNIKTGATLHDVGKLYVPAEILSKPGKLTEIEFAIIRNHPQVGYDIVKKIDFHCTVAKVILQHHERLNGSGYPNGLTAGDITIEAKIMAVADVVEAMSSHRPYRPALGIEKALDEINRNKGTLYDEKVVDICTRLFNEKQFKFE